MARSLRVGRRLFWQGERPGGPPLRHAARRANRRRAGRADLLCAQRIASDLRLQPELPGRHAALQGPAWRPPPGPHDRRTQEHPLRADTALHFEGDGNAAWGTKFVLVAARTEHRHGRIILDVEWVPTPGGEARTAVDCFTRLAPHTPGAQGVIYDTALRGVHHQHLMRELGLLSINRVTAAKAGAKKPRRSERRVEKNVHIEDKRVTLADGTTRTVRLYASGGALGIAELDDTGAQRFVPIPRIRTHRNRDKSGRYRWYNDYQLPASYDDQVITVRLHANEDDQARKLNRTENLRPIPPGDPDFERLFPRRNDAESINRHIEDTMWLGRAHSNGHARQHLNLLGFALTVNSLALHRHREREAPQIAA